MFFVGGVMPGSTVAAASTIQVGDLVASVDGIVLSSSDSVEDAVRFIDEPRETVAELLLMRDVPGAGVQRLNVRFWRIWNDQDRHFAGAQSDDSTCDDDLTIKSSPRSFDSTSQSDASQSVQRYRPVNSLGSFDTQISSRQQSPRGERRGSRLFNEVRDFGEYDPTRTTIELPAHATEFGIGLFLKQQSPGNDLVVSAMAPGGPAHECKRIMAGDALLSVDGRSINTFSSLNEVAAALIGPKQTHVMLQLRRALTNSAYTVTLVRRAA